MATLILPRHTTFSSDEAQALFHIHQELVRYYSDVNYIRCQSIVDQLRHRGRNPLDMILVEELVLDRDSGRTEVKFFWIVSAGRVEKYG